MEATIENTPHCRVCLISHNLADIFETFEGQLISEMITEISGVKVEKSDFLSKKICEECKSKTIEFYKFREMCIDSDCTVRFNIPFLDDADANVMVESPDETSKRASEQMNQLEEYFIEDDDSITDSEFQEQLVVFDDELFVNDDEDSCRDRKSVDQTNFEDSTNTKDSIVIERVNTRASVANSIVFQPSDELTNKMREAHFAKERQKKHKCPHCDKLFMYPSKVNRHVQAIHKNTTGPKKNILKNHHCNICGKAFVSQFKVRRHLVVHDTELKMGLQKNWSRNYFLCEDCNKKFHTQSTFDRHKLICDLLQKSLIERPEDHEYFCVICALIFTSADEMVDHIKSHPQATHQCVLCLDVSGHLNDMIRHGKHHEENVVYRCCVCQKTYPNGDEIVAHLLRHKEYKPFTCHECGKSFFDKYKLRQHLNTHDPTVPKNFICEFCNRAFAAQDYLNCHIRRKHSDSKPFQCDFCPKSFAFLHDLNLHLTTHTGDKKHICHVCDASFTKGWSLKQHLTLHEINQPSQQCHICDFKSTSKSQLQDHLTTHVDSEETSFTYMEAVSEDADQDSFNNMVEIQTTY